MRIKFLCDTFLFSDWFLFLLLQIRRCHLQHHENDFNTTHTKLLLKEFLDTKKQLKSTTKLAEETQTELQDTKLKLEATTKELEKAKKDIVELETRFEQQHNEIIPLIHKSTEIISQKLIKVQTQSPEEIFKYFLNTFEETTQLKIQPPIQTKEKKYEFFEFNKLILQAQKIVDVVRLMGELVQPNPSRTTQQTYAEKIQRVFNEINEGQLFHINDNECFFKLRLQRNYRKFRINHRDDVTDYRNEDTEFTNDVVALNDGRSSGGSGYELHVAIEKYDMNNCRSYVINVKECGKNHLLKYGYGYNVDIRWELYKNKNDEVIFYFNKKWTFFSVLFFYIALFLNFTNERTNERFTSLCLLFSYILFLNKQMY